MASERSFEALSEFFWKLEKEEDLLNWKVAGVHIWVEIRTKLYYSILAKELGLEEKNAVASTKKGPEHEVTAGQAEAYWSKISRSKPKHQGRTALMPFNRRAKDGTDPLTTDLAKLLPADTLVLGTGIVDMADPSRISMVRLQQFFQKRYRIPAALVSVAAVTKSHRLKHAKIINRLETEFDVDLSKWSNFFIYDLRRFLSERWGYRKVFRAEGIRTLYLVNGERPSVIAGAQDAGVKVLELQHGMLSKLHMRYNWPGKPAVPHSPDEFLVWGEYWRDTANYAGSCSVKVMGANVHFEKYRKQIDQKIANQAVMISQPSLSVQFLEAAIKTAKVLPKINFIVKPHPRENVDTLVQRLGQEAKLHNLRIADRNEDTLKLIVESEYCFGVSSTSIFEAVALQTKVLIFDLPGWNHSQSLIDRGEAILVTNPDEVATFLRQAKCSPNPDYYYANGSILLPEIVQSNL